MQILFAIANKTVMVLTLLLFFSFANNAFAQRDAVDEAAPTVVEAGAFRIHVYADNARIVAQVKLIGEKTWEVASNLYGSSLPEEKMDVHLYRNVDGYVAADEELNGGRLKRNQAFAHFDTLSAHVALQPPISNSLLKEVGLPKQSARLLAHEMSHLVRYARMPNTFRDHPDWLVDGMASLVDEKVLTATDCIDGPMHDPNFGSYVGHGKQLLDANKLPSAKQLLDDESLEIGFHQEYAVRWLFVDMLFTNYEEQFSSFLEGLRGLRGENTYAKRTKELLLKHLATDVKTLEQNFRDHVKQLKPNWIENGRLLETHGKVWDQLAFPDSTATSWNQSALGDSFVISTNVLIHEAGRNQLNMRIGQPNSFTQFSITAGYGLNVFDVENGKWETRVAKKLDGIKTGESFKLELFFDEKKKESIVKLDGKSVFTGPMERRSKDQFALGAQQGSAISWGELKIQ